MKMNEWSEWMNRNRWSNGWRGKDGTMNGATDGGTHGTNGATG